MFTLLSYKLKGIVYEVTPSNSYMDEIWFNIIVKHKSETSARVGYYPSNLFLFGIENT